MRNFSQCVGFFDFVFIYMSFRCSQCFWCLARVSTSISISKFIVSSFIFLISLAFFISLSLAISLHILPCFSDYICLLPVASQTCERTGRRVGARGASRAPQRTARAVADCRGRGMRMPLWVRDREVVIAVETWPKYFSSHFFIVKEKTNMKF